MTAVSRPPRVPANDQFSTGLFDCGLDPEGCLITFFCPFVSMGQNKAAVDGRDCLFSDCACPSTEYFTRKQLKAKYGIREDPAVSICKQREESADHTELAVALNRVE